jgi:hypothetical protein
MRTFEETIGGRLVRTTARDEQGALVADVFRVLARIAREDPPRSGMTLRLGWTLFTLVMDSDALLLCEPDFGSDPLIRTRPGIATSLQVLAEQAAFARACAVEPIDVRFDAILLTGKGALASPSIQAFRNAQDDPGDSGWTVTPAGTVEASENADDYEAIRSWQLLTLRPALLPGLILPPDHGLMLEDGRPLRAVGLH